MEEQKFEYVNYDLVKQVEGNNVHWKVLNPMNDVTPLIGINFQEGCNLKQAEWFTISQNHFEDYPHSPLWGERKLALDEAFEAITYFKNVINENQSISYTIEELGDLVDNNDITVEEILSHGDTSLLKFDVDINIDLSSELVKKVTNEAENSEDFFRLLSESLDEDTATNQMINNKVWDFVDSSLEYYIKGDNRKDIYSNIDEMLHASLMDTAQSAYPIEYTFTDSLGLLKFI